MISAEQLAAVERTLTAAWGDSPCAEYDPDCPECIARAAQAAVLGATCPK